VRGKRWRKIREERKRKKDGGQYYRRMRENRGRQREMTREIRDYLRAEDNI